MFVKRNKNGIIYYTSPLFDSLGIPHLFATRFGGVSDGVFDSLNVSTARKDADGRTDTPKNVEENYRRALSVLRVKSENACAAKQVHSDTVLEAASCDGGKGILSKASQMPDCDGIFVRKNTENISAVCVKTADCVPILMKNIKSGDVCAVHAGWRGTVMDIVGKAAQKIADGNMSDVVVAIGPCIGQCCYEVGTEVYTAFEQLFESKAEGYDMNTLFTKDRHLDLALANRELLKFVGVDAENIDISGICTCCFGDEFFSHRASGGYSGTFVSAVSL